MVLGGRVRLDYWAYTSPLVREGQIGLQFPVLPV